MVICLERGADLHMARLVPLPLTVSCFSKIQIGFTFLVPAHPGSPEKRPINGCMYACISLSAIFFQINHLKICHADLLQICRVRMVVDDKSKISLKSLNGRCRGNQSSQNDSGSKERRKFRIGPRRRQQEAQL